MNFYMKYKIKKRYKYKLEININKYNLKKKLKAFF